MKAKKILKAINEIREYCQKHQNFKCRETCPFSCKANNAFFCALDYFMTQTGQGVIDDAVRRIFG